MDRLTKARRSWVMSRIRSTDTVPELAVRSALHRLGYRFVLHRKDLPGAPDIVLPKHRTVVFVHGCFWHRHKGCKYAYTPKTRRAFWNRKFEANVRRDREVKRQLRKQGWRVIVVWECRTSPAERLTKSLSTAMTRHARVTPGPKHSTDRKVVVQRLQGKGRARERSRRAAIGARL